MINFPANPSENQTFSVAGVTYTFQGGAWVILGSTGPTGAFVKITRQKPANLTDAVSLTWAEGAYKEIQVILSGLRFSGANVADLMLQVQKGGTVINQNGTYNTTRSWWWQATGNVFTAPAPGAYLTAGGIVSDVGLSGRVDVTDDNEHSPPYVGIFGHTVYTHAQTPSFSQCLCAAETGVGAPGKLSGVRLALTAGAKFWAAGEIVVLGLAS